MNTIELENTLNAKDINPTAMRILVLNYLQQQSFAVSLADVERDFQHSDRTTIYRTLKTFENKGLIHTINDGLAAKYALCVDDCSEKKIHQHTHIHFNCCVCKTTFCLNKVAVPEFAIPREFDLQSLDIVAKGICDQCNQVQQH